MKTIPVSWKPGATTNRDLWYNNCGTPIILIRIQRVAGGYIRIGSKYIQFQEEGGGTHIYDDKYFKTIGNIDMGINDFDSVGWVAFMGATSILINNGLIMGDKFTDTYDLEELINATVDIFFLPDECGNYNTGNSIKVYSGKIVNYHMAGENSMIELSVEEYSITKQIKIPMTVEELKNKFTTGWTIPDTYDTKIVPICFGTTYFKIVCCDVPYSGNLRNSSFVIGYPIPDSISINGRLKYWDETNKNFGGIPSPNWLETKYSSWDTHTVKILDIWDLEKPVKNAIRLTPAVVDEISTYAAGDKNSINDINIISEEKDTVTVGTYVAHIYHNDLTSSYATIWRLTFNREQFPADGTIFNMYAVFDLIYMGADETPLGQWNIEIVNFSGASGGAISTAAFSKVVDGSGGATGRSCDSVVFDYAPTNAAESYYARNRSEIATYLKNHAKASDITDDNVYLDIQLKQLDTDPHTRTYQQHEWYIMVLPITPTRDYYVYGSYGNNTIQDCINVIFDYINLQHDKFISFVNFATNYNLDGEIIETDYSFNILSKLAKQFGLIYYDNENGTSKFIDINTKSADYTITDADILMGENGGLKIFLEKSSSDIYSKFTANYRLNLASGNYDRQRYLNKDYENFDYISPTTLQGLCLAAYQNYDTEKEFIINLDFVRNDETAEEILQKAIKMLTYKPKVIKFETSLRMMDLEIGDQIKFNTSFFTDNSKHFYITKKSGNYMYDSATIEFEAIESPWSS